MKICIRCKQEKGDNAFHKCKREKDGLSACCKLCSNTYARKYYLESDKGGQLHAKEYRRKQKIDLMDHYGGKCICCGETELDFLTIDHIDGNGNTHRKLLNKGRVGAGLGFYCWLKRNNYPEGYQVLCWNCNWGKHINEGICPHKTKEKRNEEIFTTT